MQRVKVRHFHGIENKQITERRLDGEVSVGESLCLSPHTELSPGTFLSDLFSLEAEDESCSEEWPQAQASMNAHAQQPRLFQGTLSLRFKSFLRMRTKLAKLLNLKSI